MCGWIKLHRKLMESPIYTDVVLLKAWVHCLLSATHTEHTTLIGRHGVTLQPGQFVTGRKKMAQETGLSEKQVRNALNTLNVLKMLTVDTSQGQAASVITVCNWSVYQDSDGSQGQDTAKKGPSKGQVRATRQECKNETMERKEQLLPPDANASFPQGGSPLSEQPETTATAAPDTTFSEKTPASPVDDSEATDKAITLPTPSKAHSGARKREKKAYPEKIAALLDRFTEIRKSDDSRDVASRSIAKLIKQGFTHDELMRCIERYHRTIENPDYPYKVGNFFGQKAYFKGYLDENFTEPEPKRASPFGTLEEQMEAFGLVNTYKWTPEDDLIHIPTPEEEAAKWEAFFEREKKREQEEAHEHTLVS